MSDRLRQIIEAVYPELRRMARNKLSREKSKHALGPTALTNEVLLRLLQRERAGEDLALLVRDGFIEMRSVLIDYARKHRKQGQAADEPGDLADRKAAFENAVDVEVLLERLEQVDARAAEVVRLRYFLGLTQAETAKFLGLNEKTVQRDWAFARAWLKENWRLQQ